MKKTLSLLILIGILLVFDFVVAKDQPLGQPFSSIWNTLGQTSSIWQE